MKKLIAITLALLMLGCSSPVARQDTGKRIIVLGIDGMDPGFVERHWDSLPNLDKLRNQGTFQRLATTMPPQSPVAWSTFITGLTPEKHGIWDFVHRDPATAMPISSMSEVQEPERQLSIGPYNIPLSEGKVKAHRDGSPFWLSLAAKGVETTILRMPTDFPAAECEGQSLSGMGTPDLLGTFGTFSFFTDDPTVLERKDLSPGVIMPVRLDNQHVELVIDGPANTLRKDHQRTTVTVKVDVDPKQAVALFEAGGKKVVLKQGEWSEWLPVTIPLLGPVASAHGMIRLYAKQLKPGFQVYVSPVNIDAMKPDLPISNPKTYSTDLAKSVGEFYTQGMAEDTAALRKGVLTRQEYLQQAALVHKEHLAILHHAISKQKDGFLFFHFFGVDQNSHMLWGKHEGELLETYKLVDRTVGEVMKQAPDATLIVMSDHGFNTFERAVNLNAWLMKEGYLTLTDPKLAGDVEAFVNVDWSKTKAYAVGLNAIYLNQQGREDQGIVHSSARPGLLDEIEKKLLTFRDPRTGEAVIDRLYRLNPDRPETAPDLLVGYMQRYRASWKTVLGSVPVDLVEDNTDAWMGDHCISDRFVPGLLISNKKTRLSDPALADLPYTFLKEYGVTPGTKLEGRNLF
jgi:predicted AlkP superfamily phosphohydrolase/phosphomutase